jgi:phosphate transport system substrate-binding protein
VRAMNATTSRRLVSLVAGAGLLLAACGGGDSGGDGGAGDDGLSGSVVISGSSTVEPITIAVAERFNDEHPDVDIPVDGPGTGDGFELFCNGETDINDASSKIKQEQIDACTENGIEFIELQIANDGIAIMTNEANDEVECLSFADLYALTGPESQGVDNWSDAADLAKELGSTTELPDAPLDVVGPGEESGTFSSYVELVIEEFNEDRGKEATTRPDYQASADDNVIIQGIQGSETSLGWVGFAFAGEAEGVKILGISEGDECILPTAETIADNSYPISRPLFIYVNAANVEENEALATFVDFYLNEAIDSVGEVGYVDLADADLEATRTRWDERTVGAK